MTVLSAMVDVTNNTFMPTVVAHSIIRDVATRLHQGVPLQDTLNDIVTALYEVLKADRVVAFRLTPDKSQGQVVAEAVSPDYSALLGQIIRDEYFRKYMVTAYLNGRIQVTHDVEDGSLSPCHVDLLRRIEARAVMVVPVVYDQNLWGLLAVYQGQQPRHWQPAEIELLQLLATQISLALKQAALQAKTEVEMRQNQASINALAKSTELYSNILESISDAVFVTDQAGKFTFICPNVEVVFGYCQAEVFQFGTIQKLLGRDLVDPATLNRHGELTNIDWSITDKAGTIHHLLITVKQVSIEAGTVLYTCRDITQRKQAEIQLKKRESHYRQLVEHLPAGLVVHGADTQIVTCNPQACELLGLSLEQLTGKTAIDPDWQFLREDGSIMPPEEYPVQQVLQSQSSLNNYIVGVQRPGNQGQIWALVNAYPIHDHHRLEEVVVTFVDITDLKKAQAELRYSEARYRLLFHEANDMVLIHPLGTVDAPGCKLLEVNDVTCRLLGYSRDELLQMTPLDLIPPLELQEVPEELETLTETGQLLFEKTLLTKAGEAIPVELHAHVFDWQGQPAVLSVARDIRDRKAAALALTHQRDLNQLSSEINRQFVDVTPQSIDGAIHHALEQLGQFLDIDSSHLVKADAATGRFTMTHEWHRPDVEPTQPQLQNLSSEDFPWAGQQLLQQQLVYVPDIADLPPEAAVDQAQWQARQITSVLAIPVINKGHTVGFIGLACRHKPQQWNDDTLHLLQGVGETIANAQARVDAEYQVYLKEERLRLALMASDQGLYDLNLQNDEAITSPAYALMLGYNPAQFTETVASWRQRIHPEDQARATKAYRDYAEGKTPNYSVEFRLQNGSGDWTWILSTGKFVEWDESGNPTRMLGTHTDISPRKRIEAERLRAEAALRASETRFREAFEHMGVGMCISNTKGRFVQVNQRFCHITGFSSEELLGRSFVEITHPDDVATDMNQVQQLLQGFHDSYSIEKRYVRKDGATIWVNLTVSLIRTAEGEPQQFMGAIEDITARKTAEAKLQQLNRTLEQRVAERTASLAKANHCLQDQTEALHQSNQLLTLDIDPTRKPKTLKEKILTRLCYGVAPEILKVSSFTTDFILKKRQPKPFLANLNIFQNVGNKLNRFVKN
jgi:PAS domain S-box-containing protein